MAAEGLSGVDIDDIFRKKERPKELASKQNAELSSSRNARSGVTGSPTGELDAVGSRTGELGVAGSRTGELDVAGSRTGELGVAGSNTGELGAGKRVASQRRRKPGEVREAEAKLKVKMQPLLDAVDKLQRDGVLADDEKLDLPKIVVVGDQSDGKSTLLEAISGVRLPKKGGMCTRCPMQISARSDQQFAAKVRCQSQQTQQAQSLEDLEKILGSVQNQLAPGDRKVTNEVLQVEVRDTSLPNLTLIDLPGITRHEEETEEQIITMIKKFISSSLAVIVVVAKAANDIETSEGLKLARQLDPKGERTIIVVTHCDGSLETKEERLRELPSKKSEVFFVNCFVKSGEDASRNGIFEKERKFFKDHPVFREFPEETLGTESLIETLSEKLAQMLEPLEREIRKKTNMHLEATEDNLRKLKKGEEALKREGKELLDSIQTEIKELVTGTHRYEKNELFDECRDRWGKYRESVMQKAEETKEQVSEYIKEELPSQKGREDSHLVNVFPVTERIVRTRLLPGFRKESADMFEDVKSIVDSHINKVFEKKFGEHPGRSKLRRRLQEDLEPEIEECKRKAKKRMEETLEAEETFFTENPRFETSLQKRLNRFNKKQNSTLKKLVSAAFAEEDKTSDGESDGESHPDTGDNSSVIEKISKISSGLTTLWLLTGQGGATLNLGFQAVATLPRIMEFLQSNQEFPSWDVNDKLLHVTQAYIDVARDRVIDTVPMTIIKFLHLNIAKRLICIWNPLEDGSLKDLMDDPEKAGKIERAEESLEEWRDIKRRLNQ